MHAFFGERKFEPQKATRFPGVKIANLTQKIPNFGTKMAKNATKTQKMHFFWKKMQKNFGSSKISSTFAAGFAQKSKIRVETSSLKDWNNRCSTRLKL